MNRKKRCFLALALAIMFSVNAFADDKGKETPQKEETIGMYIDVCGTLESVSINGSTITIVCVGNEGCCFTICNNELELYSRDASSSNYVVTNVQSQTVSKDRRIYVLSVQ